MNILTNMYDVGYTITKDGYFSPNDMIENLLPSKYVIDHIDDFIQYKKEVISDADKQQNQENFDVRQQFFFKSIKGELLPFQSFLDSSKMNQWLDKLLIEKGKEKEVEGIDGHLFIQHNKEGIIFLRVFKKTRLKLSLKIEEHRFKELVEDIKKRVNTISEKLYEEVLNSSNTEVSS